ncbi:nuclear transport factor 2 family protein [Qipengyuania xiapuensis]|uniref:Nuclear transport factor 2 family protein n=1 Tax=Qipengyuania xiapuensis TaxID=2867236 RepID=A0ABX8ZTG3_9SPHN|nr:nuclear transport factor 2 family protein [Qipengyuania xiapuensis]QZD92275.1 nuclear transport factor 2 family protein [Qipengyuania xiapuensis]
MFFKDQRKDAARQLMAAFNAHDHLALAKCITADCTFIDSSGGRLEGRSNIVEATRMFMTMEPEFHIEVDSYSVVGDEVLMQGETTAKDPLVAKDRLWRARVEDGRIAEFQTYCDGEPRQLARLLGQGADQM